MKDMLVHRNFEHLPDYGVNIGELVQREASVGVWMLTIYDIVGYYNTEDIALTMLYVNQPDEDEVIRQLQKVDEKYSLQWLDDMGLEDRMGYLYTEGHTSFGEYYADLELKEVKP